MNPFENKMNTDKIKAWRDWTIDHDRNGKLVALYNGDTCTRYVCKVTYHLFKKVLSMEN